MNSWRPYAEVAVIAATLAAVGITSLHYITTTTKYRVYYYGSANTEHDQIYGSMVDSDLTYGLYCQSTSDLIHSDEGDVYITGRAGSAIDCRYTSESLLGIAVIGWGNIEEEVTERRDNSLSISQGGWGAPAAYGSAVDFNVRAGSLSEAMPLMANIVTEIHEELGYELSTYRLRELLIASTDGWKESNGRRYGRIINVDRAIDYAINGVPVPPTEPCVGTGCAFLPGSVYSLLLLN